MNRHRERWGLIFVELPIVTVLLIAFYVIFHIIIVKGGGHPWVPPVIKRQWIRHRSVGAFVSSICAHPAYGVSEAGMNAMTMTAAKEFVADGILVNAITPGSIDTPLTDSLDETQKEQFRQAAP